MPNEELGRKDAERLAIVEEQLRQVSTVLIRVEGKLDAWHATFVPRPEINEMFSARDKQIDEIKVDIRNMQTEQIDSLRGDVTALQQRRNAGITARPHWVLLGVSVLSMLTAVVSLIYMLAKG